MFASEYYGQSRPPLRAPETHASFSEYDALHRLVSELEQQNRTLTRQNAQLVHSVNKSDARLRSLMGPSGATREAREARETRFRPAAVATGRGDASGHFKRSSAVEQRVGGSRFHAQPARSPHHQNKHHRGGFSGGGGVDAGAAGPPIRSEQDAAESSRHEVGKEVGGSMGEDM